MLYAYIKDGALQLGPTELPIAWGNTSGFNLMPPKELALLGWVPWEVVDTPPPNEAHVLDKPTIHIYEDKVVETKKYRLLTQNEINDMNANRLEANRRMRALEFREHADPLFFKAQRNEATMEEWLAKVQEIKDMYPT